MEWKKALAHATRPIPAPRRSERSTGWLASPVPHQAVSSTDDYSMLKKKPKSAPTEPGSHHSLVNQIRAAIPHKTTKSSSLAGIRNQRKRAEAQKKKTKAPPGAAGVRQTQRRTEFSKRPEATYRTPGEKTEQLRWLCYLLALSTGEDVGAPDFEELRGMVGVLLWDRHDLPTPHAPEMFLQKDAEHRAIKLRQLKAFNAIVETEAENYKQARH